ncbi:MAG: hypothetical protein JSU95_07850 [Betaproteobacteria bacterium]|nr:MAG: hypothetical protein JSU95_07850 [Betaproteobacteria bacterium]
MALHVGHYRPRYGDVPIIESLELLATEKINDEMVVSLVAGFEALKAFDRCKGWTDSLKTHAEELRVRTQDPQAV